MEAAVLPRPLGTTAKAESVGRGPRLCTDVRGSLGTRHSRRSASDSSGACLHDCKPGPWRVRGRRYVTFPAGATPENHPVESSRRSRGPLESLAICDGIRLA